MRGRSLVIGGLLFIALVSVLLTACGTSVLSNRMNYQGRLTDAAGNPINGTKNMVFRLYNVSSGGTAVWTETQNNVPVTNGLFNVVLGSVTSLDEANFHMPLWLEVVVDGEALPRQQLYGSPYAFSLVPGAVIKGYVNSTETYSSTLTVANFGSGQGLAVVSTGGPAIVAQGSFAFLADGPIQSSAKSYVSISGNSLMRNLSSDTTRWDMVSNGSALVYRGGALGNKYIYYPVVIPSVLYGTPARVTRLTVYYRCQDGTKNYISATYLYKQTDAGSSVTLISDGTDRTSNTVTSYTLNTSGDNVLTADQGILGLYLLLNFADDSNWVQIGGMRLELEYRQ